VAYRVRQWFELLRHGRWSDFGDGEQFGPLHSIGQLAAKLLLRAGVEHALRQARQSVDFAHAAID
jgi:hypothetical protein